MLLQILLALCFIIVILGLYYIPKWLSHYKGGQSFFTSLDPNTGCVLTVNSSYIESLYTDKNGVAQTGIISQGGTYAGVKVPLGYSLKPCIEPELVGKLEITPVEDTTIYSLYISLLRKVGIYWIGFFKQRWSYRFSFNQFVKTSGSEKRILSRNEPTNFFYIEQQYVFYVGGTDGVEINGDWVYFTVTLTVKISVPEIAFGNNADYLAKVNDLIDEQVSIYFRDKEFKVIGTEPIKQGFAQKIEDQRAEIKKTIGVSLSEIKIVDFSGKFQKDLIKSMQSEQEQINLGKGAIAKEKAAAEVKKVAADADLYVTNLKTDGETRRIRETFGEAEKHLHVVELSRFDAMKQAKGTIVFDANSHMSDDAKKILVATDRMLSEKDDKTSPNEATTEENKTVGNKPPTQNNDKKKKGGTK